MKVKWKWSHKKWQKKKRKIAPFNTSFRWKWESGPENYLWHEQWAKNLYDTHTHTHTRSFQNCRSTASRFDIYDLNMLVHGSHFICSFACAKKFVCNIQMKIFHVKLHNVGTREIFDCTGFVNLTSRIVAANENKMRQETKERQEECNLT